MSDSYGHAGGVVPHPPYSARPGGSSGQVSLQAPSPPEDLLAEFFELIKPQTLWALPWPPPLRSVSYRQPSGQSWLLSSMPHVP